MMQTGTKTYPLFTVITVTKNHYDGLEKTYKSLEKQTFKDYEWRVIDGASSDKTLEFLKGLRSASRTAKHPFTFISEEDKGIYDAMNKGIDHAQGRYLIFMNAGDCFAHKSVLSDLAELCASKPDFIYADALEPSNGAKNNKKTHYKPARSYTHIEWGMFTHHQSMVYSRFKIREHKLNYSLIYDIASDYDFTMRFLKKSQNCSYYNKAMCIFEPGGISARQAQKGRREQMMIREKNLGISVQRNLMIYCVQTLSINLKRYAPWLYRFAKGIARSFVDTSAA